MNPAIVILVALAAVAIWFLSARLFKPTGGVVKDVIDEAVYQMSEEDEDEV